MQLKTLLALEIVLNDYLTPLEIVNLGRTCFELHQAILPKIRAIMRCRLRKIQELPYYIRHFEMGSKLLRSCSLPDLTQLHQYAELGVNCYQTIDFRNPYGRWLGLEVWIDLNRKRDHQLLTELFSSEKLLSEDFPESESLNDKITQLRLNYDYVPGKLGKTLCMIDLLSEKLDTGLQQLPYLLEQRFEGETTSEVTAHALLNKCYLSPYIEVGDLLTLSREPIGSHRYYLLLRSKATQELSLTDFSILPTQAAELYSCIREQRARLVTNLGEWHESLEEDWATTYSQIMIEYFDNLCGQLETRCLTSEFRNVSNSLILLLQAICSKIIEIDPVVELDPLEFRILEESFEILDGYNALNEFSTA